MTSSKENTVPKNLYKYRSMEGESKKYTLDILRSNKLWASSPSKFNDPFDCMPKLSSVDIEKTIGTMVDKISAYYPDILNNKDNIVKGVSKKYERDFTPINVAWDKGINRIGVISLAERLDNCLMWSHYANNHEGICIEFETDLDDSFLINSLKVHYNINRPVLDVFTYIKDFIGNNFEGSIRSVLCEKAKDWEYEEEWRYFYPIEEGSDGALVRFPLGSITRIILGANSSDDCRDEIQNVIKETKSNIEVVKAKLDENEYKIVV